MSAVEAAPAEGPDQVRQRLRLRWWKEVLYVIVFYVLYSAVRNTFGSAGGVGGVVSAAAAAGVVSSRPPPAPISIGTSRFAVAARMGDTFLSAVEGVGSQYG